LRKGDIVSTEEDHLRFDDFEIETDKTGGQFIQGTIDPDTLSVIRCDVFTCRIPIQSHVDSVEEGYRSGSVTSRIVLATETPWFSSTPRNVYVIDGMTRIAAARQCLANGIRPTVPAKIYFGREFHARREMYLKLADEMSDRISKNLPVE
jgi:hypothetical protein